MYLKSIKHLYGIVIVVVFVNIPCDAIIRSELSRVIWGLLGEDDKKRIEQAIISIPNKKKGQMGNASIETRNRLLGCVPVDMLISDEAQRIRDELNATGDLPTNEHPYKISEWTGHDEDYWCSLPDKSMLDRLRSFEKPIKEFSEGSKGSIPDFESIDAILPKIVDLYKTLIEYGHESEARIAQSWHILAEACERIARNISCDVNASVRCIVRNILLQAAAHPDPIYKAEDHERFDGTGWGVAPRITAADGLILLARISECADTEVLAAIDRLSIDPVPAVRFQIAHRLDALYETAQGLMWKIFERMLQAEQTNGVLDALLYGVSRLSWKHTDRIVDAVILIWERVKDRDNNADHVRRDCAGLLTDLYLYQDHPSGHSFIIGLLDEPASYSTELLSILSHTEPAAFGIHNNKEIPQQVRIKALELENQILQSARLAFEDIPSGEEASDLVQMLVSRDGLRVHLSPLFQPLQHDPLKAPDTQRGTSTLILIESIRQFG